MLHGARAGHDPSGGSIDNTLVGSPMECDDVNAGVLTAISASVALVLGFTVSFVVTPDPTGILPVVVGLVLAGAATPVLRFGIRRLSAPGERST